MPMYDQLTAEEECAIFKGYLAGRAGDEKDPPETYKDKTVLLVCWYWAHPQSRKNMPIIRIAWSRN